MQIKSQQTRKKISILEKYSVECTTVAIKNMVLSFMQDASYTINAAVDKLARGHFIRSLILRTLFLLTVLNFCAGVLFLSLRHLKVNTEYFVLFYLTGCFVMLFIAFFYAYNKNIEKTKWLAVLDDLNDFGGLLVSSDELFDKSWITTNTRINKIPEFNVSYFKKFKYTALSFIFMILCLTVPVDGLMPTSNRLELNEVEEILNKQIQTLNEEGLIKTDEAKEFLKSLEQITNNSDGKDPSKSFEALDHLREKLKKAANAGAMDLASELNSLEKLNKTENAINSELPKEAQRYLENMGLDNPKDASERKKAEDELKKYIEDRFEKVRYTVDKLAQQNLISSDVQKHINENSNNVSDSNQIMTTQDSGKESNNTNEQSSSGEGSGESSGEGSGENPGSSQIPGSTPNKGTDGGGHEPLNYNRITSDHNSKFIDHKLPATGIVDFEGSISVGIGISAPLTNQPEPSGSGAGSLNLQDTDKIHVGKETILPRHKNAVIEYFGGNGAK